MTTKLITPDQSKQILRILEDAAHTAHGQFGELAFTREEAQRILESGDVVKSAVVTAALNAIREAAKPGPQFRYDKSDDEWELIEDRGFNPPITSIDQVELVGFLKSGEDLINGEEMVRRASKELNANAGQRHLEWLLENQAAIPAEFRKYYLVAPGTKWRSPDGYRGVPCLGWDGGRWYLDFDWLGSGIWDDDDRLLRLGK